MKLYEPAEEGLKRESADFSNHDSDLTLHDEDLFDYCQSHRIAGPRRTYLSQCRIVEIFLAALLLVTNMAWYLGFDH